MQLLLENIEKYISLTHEEKQHISARIEIQSHKARSILLNAGEVCKHSYFVRIGVLRSFYINDSISEHVMHFACEGWWISDMYSLITQKPGNLFIEVLEDSEVLLLSKTAQEELYQLVPKLERFFRILVENSLVSHQERLLDNLSLTAEERFEKFCHKFPSLIQRIPQKHIASYIGVTPEFFSSMKSRLLKKK